MPAGLIALALGGFGIGLTEFVITGLLPEVAADYGSPRPRPAGSSPATPSRSSSRPRLTAATTRLPRKQVLVGLLVLFVVGNTLSAAAPTYA